MFEIPPGFYGDAVLRDLTRAEILERGLRAALDLAPFVSMKGKILTAVANPRTGKLTFTWGIYEVTKGKPQGATEAI